MDDLCAYGCGNVATHTFKNGTKSCSTNPSKCDAVRKRLVEFQKKQTSHHVTQKASNNQEQRVASAEKMLQMLTSQSILTRVRVMANYKAKYVKCATLCLKATTRTKRRVQLVVEMSI